MEENKDLLNKNLSDSEKEEIEETLEETENAIPENANVGEIEEKPLDKNVRLMSPMRMIVRRFFRSKLSVAGIIMLAALFVFSWLGPIVYHPYGPNDSDMNGNIEYTEYTVTLDDGTTFIQMVAKHNQINKLASSSKEHLLGTDEQGMDIFVRLMYGGRLSLSLSFISVFLVSALGIIMGGLAGYYGGIVDNIIMRLCDILMCLPSLPLMLIIGTILDANGVPGKYYIYLLMSFLALFSWTGMARLVRGQILYLREQEYMVAAEAMGYSGARKIFKHLIPNILPQIIVTMTLSLGGMILSESTLSYLGLGVQPPNASWGTMIEIISKRPDILKNNFNVWAPAGICIVIAVLGFNFIGDGLRDALDPKQRR